MRMILFSLLLVSQTVFASSDLLINVMNVIARNSLGTICVSPICISQFTKIDCSLRHEACDLNDTVLGKSIKLTGDDALDFINYLISKDIDSCAINADYCKVEKMTCSHSGQASSASCVVEQ